MAYTAVSSSASKCSASVFFFSTPPAGAGGTKTGIGCESKAVAWLQVKEVLSPERRTKV